MVVGMWMTTDLVTVLPNTPLFRAAATMAKKNIRRLLVAEPGEGGLTLLGIVSSKDIARAFPPDLNPFSVAAAEGSETRPVGEIMTREVRTVSSDTAIEDAARILRRLKVGALPVLRGGHLIGIITESDIFDAFLELVGVTETGVRVTFDLAGDEDLVGVASKAARKFHMRLASILTLNHHDRQTGAGRRLGVLRLAGEGSQRLIDDLWRSGYRIVSVHWSGREQSPPAE